MLYSFDLSNFESGKFTATRHPANRAVGGDWVTFAKDDAEALELATVAANEEWSAPESRGEYDFEVEFVNA